MAGTVLAGIVAVVLGSTDWAAIIKPAAKQVPRLEILAAGATSPGICSGVVINKSGGYVLTAAHCLGDEHRNTSITVNGRHALIVRSNRLLDLAVVRTELKDEQEMP
jgi:S1-C subfamily serine protease